MYRNYFFNGGRSQDPPPSHPQKGYSGTLTGLFAKIAKDNSPLLGQLVYEAPHLANDVWASRLYCDPKPLCKLSVPWSNPEVSTVESTEIRVVSYDALDCAHWLFRTGRMDVAVLNMADPNRPGGDYDRGGSGLEESLCRRSTLHVSLTRWGFYPLPPHSAIYSRNVLVVRKPDYKRCEELHRNERWCVDIISVAGHWPRLHYFRTDASLTREDKEEMREHIRVMFRVAAWEQRKNLVVGAYGHYAFDNHRTEVAILFREVLSEREFKGRFQGIWFVVVTAHSLYSEPFYEELQCLRI